MIQQNTQIGAATAKPGESEEEDSESRLQQDVAFFSPYYPQINVKYDDCGDHMRAELLIEDKIVLLGGGVLFGLSVGFQAAVLVASVIRNESLVTIIYCGLGSLTVTFFNVLLYRRSLLLRESRQPDQPSLVASVTQETKP